MPIYPAQAAYLDSRAAYRGFVGGRGAGKSFVGAYDLIRRAKPGRLYLVAAPTYPMLRDATLRTFLDVAGRVGVPVAFRRAEMTARVGGAEVLFRSADDPDRLRGPNLSGAWLDEGSVMHEEAAGVVTAALREKGEQGWLGITFTPKGLAHWTYERFGPKRPPHTEVFHAKSAENPFLPADFSETVATQYDGLTALQELGGEFVDVEGSEWPAEYFAERVWFEDWPPGRLLTVVSLDPSRGRESKAGDYACYVVLKMDAEATFWVDAHFFRCGIPQLVSEGVRLAGEHRPDFTTIEVNIGQELLAAEFTRQQLAAKVLFPVHTVENHLPKPTRIRRLGPYLARGRIRFRDTPGGKLLAAQLQQFPFGKFDDGPDALEMAIRLLEEVTKGR